MVWFHSRRATCPAVSSHQPPGKRHPEGEFVVVAEFAGSTRGAKVLSHAVTRVSLMQEPRSESIEDWTEDRQRRVASWTFGTGSLLRVRKQITLHIEADPGTIGKDTRVRQILNS
jgi:hypothetical protein